MNIGDINKREIIFVTKQLLNHYNKEKTEFTLSKEKFDLNAVKFDKYKNEVVFHYFEMIRKEELNAKEAKKFIRDISKVIETTTFPKRDKYDDLFLEVVDYLTKEHRFLMTLFSVKEHSNPEKADVFPYFHYLRYNVNIFYKYYLNDKYKMMYLKNIISKTVDNEQYADTYNLAKELKENFPSRIKSQIDENPTEIRQILKLGEPVRNYNDFYKLVTSRPKVGGIVKNYNEKDNKLLKIYNALSIVFELEGDFDEFREAMEGGFGHLNLKEKKNPLFKKSLDKYQIGLLMEKLLELDFFDIDIVNIEFRSKKYDCIYNIEEALEQLRGYEKATENFEKHNETKRKLDKLFAEI